MTGTQSEIEPNSLEYTTPEEFRALVAQIYDIGRANPEVFNKIQDHRDNGKEEEFFDTLDSVIEYHSDHLSESLSSLEALKELRSILSLKSQLTQLYKETDRNPTPFINLLHQLSIEDKGKSGSLEVGPYTIEYRTEPNFLSSGDKIVIEELDSNTYGILVLDATGHDFLAEKNASQVAEIYNHMPKAIKESCSQTLQELNSMTQGNQGLYVIASYFIVDGDKEEIKYANAGAKLFGKETIEGGFPLGILPDTNYKEGVVSLDSNEYLAAITDGIDEQKNESEELFGRERLESMLSAEPGALNKIFEANKEYQGQAKNGDDKSAVIIYRK